MLHLILLILNAILLGFNGSNVFGPYWRLPPKLLRWTVVVMMLQVFAICLLGYELLYQGTA